MREFESSHSSQAFPRPEEQPLEEEKSPLLAAFCNSASVSELPNWRTRRPFRQKSPATTANIPVLGRRAPETRFELHWVLMNAFGFGHDEVLIAKRRLQETQVSRSKKPKSPSGAKSFESQCLGRDVGQKIGRNIRRDEPAVACKGGRSSPFTRICGGLGDEAD
jgi:hypothetical protein